MPTSRNAITLRVDHDGSVAGPLDQLDQLDLLEGKRVLMSFKRVRK